MVVWTPLVRLRTLPRPRRYSHNHPSDLGVSHMKRTRCSPPLGFLPALAVDLTAHAQVVPVYRQDPVTGAATQQQNITVPPGFSWTCNGTCTGARASAVPVTGLTGTGTGVIAALQANTSAAGGMMLFGGPGGTPSSINLGNATNIPGGQLTSGSVANAALAHSSTTVNGQTCTLGSTCTVPVSGFVPVTAALTSDVSINASNPFFDGPSVAQGTTGSFIAFGSVMLTGNSGAVTLVCKLWDGTTTLASASLPLGTGAGATFP